MKAETLLLSKVPLALFQNSSLQRSSKGIGFLSLAMMQGDPGQLNSSAQRNPDLDTPRARAASKSLAAVFQVIRVNSHRN